MGIAHVFEAAVVSPCHYYFETEDKKLVYIDSLLFL